MLQRIIPNTKPRLDFLALGFWVSSILAAILAIPSIVVFVYVFTVLDNILVGALLAFGIHFVILSVSDKIANFLIRIIDGEKMKRDIHGFMASDFFTFETDEENVVVLSINEDGKEKKDVHSYMLEHQVFHAALNKYSENTPKLTY
jgi:hypothetical protein|tara:strand:- start:305 stop:742 length:438 start_codon:yes stop_codon:yes gene_type:complete